MAAPSTPAKPAPISSQLSNNNLQTGSPGAPDAPDSTIAPGDLYGTWDRTLTRISQRWPGLEEPSLNERARKTYVWKTGVTVPWFLDQGGSKPQKRSMVRSDKNKRNQVSTRKKLRNSLKANLDQHIYHFVCFFVGVDCAVVESSRSSRSSRRYGHSLGAHTGLGPGSRCRCNPHRKHLISSIGFVCPSQSGSRKGCLPGARSEPVLMPSSEDIQTSVCGVLAAGHLVEECYDLFETEPKLETIRKSREMGLQG